MKQANKRKTLIYIAVVGLLVFLFAIGALKPVENRAIRIIKPVTGTLQSFGFSIKTTLTNRQENDELRAQIEKLQGRLNESLVEQTKIELLEEENLLLRDSLGFLSRNELQYVMANTISRGGLGESLGRLETIVIDRGEKDGLSAGLAVLNSKGVVIGKITKVKESIAQVLLVNNDNCKLAATILGQEKTSGIASGELGLTIKMEFIPQAISVEKDDIVVSSGLEEKIPRGLVIGQVTEVIKENNELWQTATIEPQFDQENIAMVSVVLAR